MMDALRYLADPENRIAKAQLAIGYQNEVLRRDIDLNTLLLSDLEDSLPEGFIRKPRLLRLRP